MSNGWLRASMCTHKVFGMCPVCRHRIMRLRFRAVAFVLFLKPKTLYSLQLLGLGLNFIRLSLLERTIQQIRVMKSTVCQIVSSNFGFLCVTIHSLYAEIDDHGIVSILWHSSNRSNRDVFPFLVISLLNTFHEQIQQVQILLCSTKLINSNFHCLDDSPVFYFVILSPPL